MLGLIKTTQQNILTEEQKGIINNVLMGAFHKSNEDVQESIAAFALSYELDIKDEINEHIKNHGYNMPWEN